MAFDKRKCKFCKQSFMPTFEKEYTCVNKICNAFSASGWTTKVFLQNGVYLTYKVHCENNKFTLHELAEVKIKTENGISITTTIKKNLVNVKYKVLANYIRANTKGSIVFINWH